MTGATTQIAKSLYTSNETRVSDDIRLDGRTRLIKHGCVALISTTNETVAGVCKKKRHNDGESGGYLLLRNNEVIPRILAIEKQ